ncbi:MAG: flavodoxin domain-containing protein [Planctomycetes bacterium]|nr:flavodoxin domain-containing protein [Planctomycetota bacterium]MCA8935270.1 flavodoxin domain-containing protein [Planctomycetota bacterium]
MSLRLLIVYTTTGGNTRETAELAAEGASSVGGVEVDLYNAYGLDASILLEGDAILVGEPTWGDGEHHADFLPMDRSMGELLAPEKRLTGIPAAAFVGCDRAYRNFGRAIELVEDRLMECGALIVQRGLKIELTHNDHSRVFTRQWAHDFVLRAKGEMPPQPHRPAMTREQADAIKGVSLADRERRNQSGLRHS